MDDLDDLEAKARAAIVAGPRSGEWFIHRWAFEEDADYIAAASPDVILRLIERVRALDAEADFWSAAR